MRKTMMVTLHCLSRLAKVTFQEVIKLLIAKGADVNQRIEVKNSVRRGGILFARCIAAVWIGYIKSPNCLSLKVLMSQRRMMGVTRLYTLRSVEGGSLEVVKLLINKGVNVNSKNGEGLNPLHYAVYGNRKEIAELLIAESADVNGNNFAPPLGIAASEGHEGIVKLLIAKGADLNAVGPNGETPLTLAAMNGHKEIAEMLIAEGIDVNAMDNDGDTALHLAALNGHEKIADLLRKHGGKTGEELKA